MDIGQTLIKRYTLTARLGKGAMGIVYRALDQQTGQEVAVKVIARELALDHDMLERFRREGEALRQLQHPNIVGFVDMFELDEQHVIVMEYVPGGSLHALLKQGPLPLDRTRRMALELCDALTRAHHLNIIHRDLKPENVMLAADGTPKLTDFGVARLLSEGTRLTGTGTQVGTPFYMSPEAWEGKPLDAQTDIWSLGILLYEMLSGRVPFSGDTIVAVMNKVLNAPLPDLNNLRPDVPPGLAEIVERMLARDKSERYQSMRELAADLERGEPLTIMAEKQRSGTTKPGRTKARPAPATQAAKTRATEPKPAKGFPWWLVGAASFGLLALAVAGAGLGGWWLAKGPSLTSTATPTVIVTRPWTPAANPPTSPPLPPRTDIPNLGQALWLDGTTGYMEVPYSASLDLNQAFTLEAWVNLQATDQACVRDEPTCLIHPILAQSKDKVSSVGNYLLALQRTGLLFGFQPRSGMDALWNSTNSLSFSGWHHLAVVHVYGQPDQTKVYWDGVSQAGNWHSWDTQIEVDPAEAAIPNSHAPYLVGAMQAGNEAYFWGGLDEIRIWAVARSQEEIRATMPVKLSGQEAGLAAYWNFEDPAPVGIAHDGSPNGNDGQLRGSAQIESSLMAPGAVVTQPTLKVGLLLPFSGANASLGASAETGAQMAVDEWNAQGGLLDTPIELIPADGQCLGEPAVAAARQLFEQAQVRLVIGEICSSASIPVAAIAESTRAVLISPASTNPKVTLNDDGSPKAYVFRTSFIDPFQGTVMANFAISQGLQRAFILWDQSNDYSRGLADNFSQAFAQAGGTVVGQEAYTTDTEDFSAIAAKVAASQAQVLFLPDMASRVNLIARQARAQKVTATFMGGDGWEGSDLDLATLNGGYYTTAFSTLTAQVSAQAWTKRYQEEFGGNPDAIAALSYDTANLLFTAVRQAGTADPARVKDVLAGLTFDGITGSLTFDAQHNPVKSAIILQIKAGQRVYAGTIAP